MSAHIEDPLINSSSTRKMFGGPDRPIDPSTLGRWINNPALGFPPPIYINGRRYWRLSVLQQFAEDRAAVQCERK
jgi:hypothetical protein